MIHFYKHTSNGLEEVALLENGAWVRVQATSQDDLRYLRSTFAIPERFINHALDLDELARYETSGNVKLIVLRIPYHEGKTVHEHHKTIALSILLTPEHIITLCNHATGTLNKLSAISRDDPATLDPERFVLYALLATAEDYLDQLRHLRKTIEVTEEKLRIAQRNRELFELLKVQKSLVYFTIGLKSNEAMLRKLREEEKFDLNPEDHELLNHVLIETSQAVEITTLTEKILAQMMNTFASVISNNMNVIIKFLTAATLVISFPTLIASIYGMNVQLPFQDSPGAFPLVIVISLIVAGGVSYLFWRRGWF